ncbi:hypothetical protein E4U15_000905 [Claviceps sp. LM218 group G6]|nr:hypothetical protein E4U15_000905 [Claviceps sp. LM218 group G6]
MLCRDLKTARGCQCSPCQPTTWLGRHEYSLVLAAESRTHLIARVRQILDRGFMPLLFGDVVFDLASEHNMLSGDALVRILATSPDSDSVQRCIFVTGVAGIYTRDPKVFDDAMLARQLRCSSADTDQGVCDEPGAKGVMGSKWQWVQRIMNDDERCASRPAKSSFVKSRKRIGRWLLLVIQGTRLSLQAEL